MVRGSRNAKAIVETNLICQSLKFRNKGNENGDTLFDNAIRGSRHRMQVIDLWDSVFGDNTAHNEPALSIDKKMREADGLFYVAESDVVIGTVMCGYDGHRGWIYSLAVSNAYRQQGIGSDLMAHAENALIRRGCVKINLQILEGKKQVEKFYKKLGYDTELRINMGKRIPENII